MTGGQGNNGVCICVLPFLVIQRIFESTPESYEKENPCSKVTWRAPWRARSLVKSLTRGLGHNSNITMNTSVGHPVCQEPF